MRKTNNIIRELRESKGLSGKELADLVGISQSMVSAIEVGRRAPSDHTLEAIAKALGADVASLAVNVGVREGVEEYNASEDEQPTTVLRIPASAHVTIQGTPVTLGPLGMMIFNGQEAITITLRFENVKTLKVELQSPEAH